MDIRSPYLEAIQAVPGATPGQKFAELHSIARSFVAKLRSHGDAVPQIEIENVPEPLLPLVRLEVAKLLKQNEVIVEAIKSDDSELVSAALKMDWFFKAENQEYINVHFFKTNLLPHVSLNTRTKLIKKLATSLAASNATDLGEQLYTYFAETFGRGPAESLLMACGKSFIWETIERNSIILSCRSVKNLFIRYPELIVQYLKLSKPQKNASTHKVHTVDIYKYSHILPRLIKNHMKSFVELIEMHGSCLNIHLSNKATERFLKSNVEVVLNKPLLYVNMMPLKVIAAKITKSQFIYMFVRIFPEKVEQFSYFRVETFLQYYPEQERLSLLLDTYREVYKANMLDNADLIDSKIMRMLPADERIRQARLKIEKEPDWQKQKHNLPGVWRCYLSIDESIPLIKSDIAKSSSADDRSSLLQQMFFSCRINDDKDALLETLRYFTMRHRNERSPVIFEVLSSIVQYLDFSSFEKEHWSVLNDFMRFLHVKDELAQRPTTSRDILSAAVYFNLTHDLPVDEFLTFIVEITMRAWNLSWCILQKYPEYDRLCFHKMMQIIPAILDRPRSGKIELNVLQNIVSSLYDFNVRNVKPNAKIEKLSIKDYPWMCEVVKETVASKPTQMVWIVDRIIACLKNYEPDLYEQWVDTNKDAIPDVKSTQALKVLKNDPSSVLLSYELYYKEITSSVSYINQTQRFVKSCRWYQDIPMKFLALSFHDLKVNENSHAIYILGLLMEGSAFAGVIEPLIPADGCIDTDSENAKSSYQVLYAIPRAINIVNPPVPLSLVLAFCQGEYLSLGLASLTNVCRRVAADKIEKFTRELTDLRISVKKHGIRLFGMVASIEDYRIFLANLWKTEKHTSIRAIVFDKIRSSFVNGPCPESWDLMKECMKQLTIDDKDTFDDLVKFNDVHEQFVTDYVAQVFETIHKLQEDGASIIYLSKYLELILARIAGPFSELLSEELSEKLLKKYFFNNDFPKTVNAAAMQYVVDGYLRNGPKMESRLITFGKLYAEILRSNWDIPDPKEPNSYPINRMNHRFVVDAIAGAYEYADGYSTKCTIMQTVLKSFLTVLKPEFDYSAYATLTLGVALADAKTPEDVAEKIGETLSRLVDVIPHNLVIELANVVNIWVSNRVDGELIDLCKYKIIETFCSLNTVHSCTLAAKLLFPTCDRNLIETHNKLVDYLKKSSHPGAVALTYEYINGWDQSA